VRLGLGPIDLREIQGRRLRDLAEAATAATFDAVWMGENRGAGAGGALAAAAMVAQWTPVRVGAVVDLGLYHPLHLAEDIAVADVASAGRIEVVLRAAHDDPDVIKEHLHVLAAALGGAHIQWQGLHLRIPAQLADNGPVPQRLAVNPPPVQPVVPVWMLDPEEPSAAVADRLGFGTAARYHAGISVGPPRARLPRLLLCPGHVEAAELLAAAGDDAGYFVVGASTPEEVRAAGRRLAGPLRMPEFPDWVQARR
jgi:alkanesulfonate monooxygenase SsuD/methylene tetrahydromethanopterin reductase-like flavin-dependent oxidoreductase (luciferase family)